jgi:hypothetical protein
MRNGVVDKLHPNDRKIIDFGIERVKDLASAIGALTVRAATYLRDNFREARTAKKTTPAGIGHSRFIRAN